MTTHIETPILSGPLIRQRGDPSPRQHLNTAYAFFERNWNLTRRYLGWEVVWIVYSLVNALTILFIAAATERITGQSVDTHFFILYLLIGTTMWSYLSAVFDVVAETIAWERWEGTIEYTLMAPVPRSLHLIGTCCYAVTYSLVRAALIFCVVAVMFGVQLSSANLATVAAVVGVGSVSVIGLAIVAAVLPLLFTERGAQMTFVIHSSLLLISGVYAPVDVLPGWLQMLAPLSPMTYVLRAVRAGLLDGAPPSAVLGDLAVLALMGAFLVPAGLLVFRTAERYARRTGRLKRSG
ncbi:MAG: ABC transporter permease [Chloroflexi bacterium]|nr:ABC transporter permease [Chloroflexota bacterium]MBV9133265.1 ABC transporter permease [Chloroflexota bacterium]MBV9893975.1 ABC transporter permease [Chloroflexota bacterium]